jgi:hypothetical protein
MGKGEIMRCQCCNTALDDYESTMRHAITRQFLEMCGTCLRTVDAYIPVQVRNDLMSEADTGNLDDSLLDNIDDYVDDGGDEDMEDYWNER